MLHELKWYFLKKKIIGVREESRVQERDFRNHLGGKEDEGYKEHFRRFFYKEENFNFSPFRRKLKFHIFSCLKFCFKILKI